MKKTLYKVVSPQFRAWLYNVFLKGKNPNKALRKKILSYYRHTKDSEIKKCTDFIKKYRDVYVFNYPYIFDYYGRDIEIIYDKSVELNYVEVYGKRMYLKRTMNVKDAKDYVISLLMEQDIRSPHRYLPEDFIFYEDEVVYDIGAAEGIFALSIIDYVKKIILFECDSEWIEPLRETFRDYENVEIVKGFVGNETGNNRILLDNYIEENEAPTLIKMDIEGEEIKALEGMRNSIMSLNRMRMFVCVYHRKDDEIKIRHVIPETYDISNSDGYMIFPYDEYVEPYFRRGVLRISHK